MLPMLLKVLWLYFCSVVIFYSRIYYSLIVHSQLINTLELFLFFFAKENSAALVIVIHGFWGGNALKPVRKSQIAC